MNGLLEYYLVGGFNPLKNMKVNWDDEIPNIWENKSHVPVTTNQLLESHPLFGGKYTSILPVLKKSRSIRPGSKGFMGSWSDVSDVSSLG